jgi:hypothetical protein
VGLASPVFALDKSKPLLCASVDVHECVDGSGCREVLPEDVNVPTFFRIDLRKKEIRTSEDGAVTVIEHMDEFEGRTVLQGAAFGSTDLADGGGWTITIADDTARMTGTSTVLQSAVVVFGVCTEYK